MPENTELPTDSLPVGSVINPLYPEGVLPENIDATQNNELFLSILLPWYSEIVLKREY